MCIYFISLCTNVWKVRGKKPPNFSGKSKILVKETGSRSLHLATKKWSNESLNDGNKWWKTKHGISNLDCCRNRLRPGSSYLGQMHPEISEQNSYLKLQYAWRPIFDLSVPGKLTLCILKSMDFLQKILGRVSFTVSDACMKRCSWPLPNLFNCF